MTQVAEQFKIRGIGREDIYGAKDTQTLMLMALAAIVERLERIEVALRERGV